MRVAQRRTAAITLTAVLCISVLAAGLPLAATAGGNHEITHDPMDTSTGESNGVRSEFLVVNVEPAADFGPTTGHALEVRDPATGESVVVESAPGEERIAFGQATLRLYAGDGSIRPAPRIETPTESQLVAVTGDRAMFTEGETIAEYEVSLLDDSNGDGSYDEVVSTTGLRELGTNYPGGIEQNRASGNVTASFPIEPGAEGRYAEFQLLDGETVVVGPSEMTVDGGEFVATFDSTELADGDYTGRVSLYETSATGTRVVGGWQTDVEVRNQRGTVDIEHGERRRVPSDDAYAQWLTAELSAPVGGETIEFELRNLDTGEAVRLVPDGDVTFPSGVPLVFRANTDRGELERPPSILVAGEEVPASFEPVGRNETVTNPFESGDARYEIVLRDGDRPIDATGPRAYLTDYTHDLFQDDDSGRITLSIRRGLLSENYTARLDSDVPTGLRYDSERNRFEGTFDSTAVADGEYHWRVRFVNESAPSEPPLANVTSEAYGGYNPIVVDNGVAERTTPADTPEGDSLDAPTATARPTPVAATTVPIADANEGRQGTTVLVEPTALSEVTLPASVESGALTVRSLGTEGATLGGPPGETVHRFDISTTAELGNGSATVTAIVSPTALADAGGAAENLTFYRYDGEAWTRLDSSVTEIPTGYRVAAETPGFSRFAIVSHGATDGGGEPTPTPSTAVPVETTSPSPTPASTPTQGDGAGFGFLAGAVAALACSLARRL